MTNLHCQAKSTPDCISSHASSRAGDFLVLLTKRGRVYAATIADGGEDAAAADDDDDVGGQCGRRLRCRVSRVPWFRGDDLAAKCAAVSPCGSFSVVAARNGDLFVVPAATVAPGYVAKGRSGLDVELQFIFP